MRSKTEKSEATRDGDSRAKSEVERQQSEAAGQTGRRPRPTIAGVQRATGRCCRNCVYAVRPKGHWLRILLERWPGLLLCASSPSARGQLTEVLAEGVCRNFRPKREPAARHTPPQPTDPAIRYIGLTHGKVATAGAICGCAGRERIR